MAKCIYCGSDADYVDKDTGYCVSCAVRAEEELESRDEEECEETASEE
jgi:hypothetical protein